MMRMEAITGLDMEMRAALSGQAQWLRAGLQIKGSLVRFPVRRAHAWVAGQIPSRGRVHERQPHIDVSLPLFLPHFPSLKYINKIFKKLFLFFKKMGTSHIGLGPTLLTSLG